MMNSKVGRNEKCPCGSGKKFKKCCLNNQTNQSKTNPIISEYNSLIFKDRMNYIPQKESKILYVVKSDKLPQEIKEKVTNYISSKKLIELGCWFNSSHLSLLEDNIQTVHGYYGYKESCKVKKWYNSYIKNNHLKPNKDGFYVINDEYGIGYYDLKNEIILRPHSWNCFNDIYFDLTKEYDSYYSNKWVYYYPVKTISTSSFNPNQKSELSKLVNYVKNNNRTNVLNITKLGNNF